MIMLTIAAILAYFGYGLGLAAIAALLWAIYTARTVGAEIDRERDL